MYPGDAEQQTLFYEPYLKQIDVNKLFDRKSAFKFHMVQQRRFGVGVSSLILSRQIVYILLAVVINDYSKLHRVSKLGMSIMVMWETSRDS